MEHERLRLCIQEHMGRGLHRSMHRSHPHVGRPNSPGMEEANSPGRCCSGQEMLRISRRAAEGRSRELGTCG